METETKRGTADEPKTRQTEKAYHVLFDQIASYCIEHGIDLKMAMEAINRYEVAVTSEFVKSTWRSILKAQTGKDSTRDQTKEDVKNVEPDFKLLWEEITGQPVIFPSEENKRMVEFYSNN